MRKKQKNGMKCKPVHRYEVQHFDYADGTTLWCVYDHKDSWHIHSETHPTMDDFHNFKPETVDRICDALNLLHEQDLEDA